MRKYVRSYSLLYTYINYTHIVIYCSEMAQHKRQPTEVSLHVNYAYWLHNNYVDSYI